MKKQKANATTWQKFLEVGKWFIDFSSLSGISQYRISDNKISKTFWILSYWLGLAFTIMLVNQSFQRYLTHPYVTKVERKNAFSSPFPSVTICNPNRVHCKHLYSRIKECQKVWSYCIIKPNPIFLLYNFLIVIRYREKVHVTALRNFVVYS